MNTQLIKLLAIRYVIVVMIFLIIRYFLMFFIGNLDNSYYTIIPIVLAIILAPRLRKIKTQDDSQYYLKWIFLK